MKTTQTGTDLTIAETRDLSTDELAVVALNLDGYYTEETADYAHCLLLRRDRGLD